MRYEDPNNEHLSVCSTERDQDLQSRMGTVRPTVRYREFSKVDLNSRVDDTYQKFNDLLFFTLAFTHVVL